MKPIRLFISSVQKEFETERAALRDYLRGDALMRRFFESFLFEEVPAADPTSRPTSHSTIHPTSGGSGTSPRSGGRTGQRGIHARLGLKDRAHVRERYTAPVLAEGIIEPTIPDKPNSRLQKHRVTQQGLAFVESLRQETGPQ